MALTVSLPATIDAINLNGPDLVGYSAIGDKAPGLSDYMYFSDPTQVKKHAVNFYTVVANASRFSLNPDSILARKLAAMSLCIDMYLLYEPADGNTRDTSVASVSSAEKPSDDTVKAWTAVAKDVYDALPEGLLLCIVTKLSYWQQNHHTGSGAISAIVQKTLTFLGIKPEDMLKDGINMHALWAYARGVDTRRALAFFQLNDDNRDNAVPQPWSPNLSTRLTRELLARYQSPPAGSKAQFNIHAIMKKLAASPYALLCTPQMAVEYASFRDWDAGYADSRVALHIGGNYLCGSRTEVPQIYSEETILLASAYIRGACPKNTLSSAKAGLVDASGSTEAARVMEIRRTLTKTTADEDLREALQTHVNLDGNPFAYMVPNAFVSKVPKASRPVRRRRAPSGSQERSDAGSGDGFDGGEGRRPKRVLAQGDEEDGKDLVAAKASASDARPRKKRG